MMRTLILAAAAIAINAAAAGAQVTINGGLDWSGGYDIGTSSARLRSNATGTTPPPYTLFNVDSRIAPAPGVEVRVGYVVAPRFTVEGGMVFTRRRLAFRIFGDPETSSESLPGESLQQYVFDGAVLWEPPLGLPARLQAFALGGAGYLRQLHQDRTLIESGQVFYGGGGALYRLRDWPGSGRALGLRGDFRVNFRRNGIDFDDAMRVYPTISLLMYLVL
jgi:hypothetical protein